MIDKNVSGERSFVLRVVAVSLVLLLLFSLLGLLAVKNSDRLLSLSAGALSSVGFTDGAMAAADKIEDEALGLSTRYELAVQLQRKGSYEAALELYTKLGTYSDSQARMNECMYALAEKLFNQGDYDGARELFSRCRIGDWEKRELECIYMSAQAAFESGDYMGAVMLFGGLGDYLDAPERAFDAAFQMTGDEDSAAVIIQSGGLSADAIEKAAIVSQLRSEVNTKRLAAGSYHTVFIRDDGSVAACGDNSSGQCDVGGWENAVQVCAGKEHSVALLSDGRVLAAGSNEYGQCDVTEWENVVSIAAGDYDTLALLSDGSVKYCGYHEYDELDRGGKLEKLFAGSYAAAAVNSQGFLVSTHPSVKAENPGLIIDLALSAGCSGALYADGSLVMGNIGIEDWENIISVDIGPQALLALDTQGRVHAHFFRPEDRALIPEDTDLRLCAAGTEHYVFMAADGSLLACGDNSFGQCDVEKLIN